MPKPFPAVEREGARRIEVTVRRGGDERQRRDADDAERDADLRDVADVAIEQRDRREPDPDGEDPLPIAVLRERGDEIARVVREADVAASRD